MLQLPGFEIQEILHHGARTVVARALRAADGERVILKALAQPYPSLGDLARLDSERRALESLQGPGVPTLLEAVDHDGRRVLVLQDSEGSALGDEEVSRGIAGFLAVARSAVQALDSVHRAGLIHLDVNPSNLLLLPDGSVEVIDFDLATSLEEEASSRELVGTLACLSPEQTGRTGRRVDYRTDYYALGATTS